MGIGGLRGISMHLWRYAKSGIASMWGLLELEIQYVKVLILAVGVLFSTGVH